MAVARGIGPAVGLALALLAPVSRVAAHPVAVDVAGIGVDPATGSPVVRLVEAGEGAAARELLIWIGPSEALAIAVQMEGVQVPRPLTHDLMKQLVEQLGGHLTDVVIETVHGGTFVATLHVAGPAGKGLRVDARPSDAIALALRFHGPILVAEELLAKTSLGSQGPGDRPWGLTVQELTPEVAEFFRVRPGAGVLVADVAAAGPAHAALARGDVITAVDGEPVATVEALVRRAGTRAPEAPVRLSIRRGGRPLTVTVGGP